MFKRKKSLYVVFSLLLIVGLYLTIDINVQKICKDVPRLIRSINDLGISQLSECKNPIGLKTYLRKKSKYSLWVNSKAYNIVESIHTIWITLIIDLFVGSPEYMVNN